MTATGGGPVAAIIGLGLIGGSMARELATLGWRVHGADADPRTLDAARGAGILPFQADAGPDEPVDVAVVAVPLGVAPAVVRGLRGWARPPAAVTDVGSTKRSILEAADAAGLGGRFVGSHPMAGDHRSGWDAARPGLFRHAPVWLCPPRPAGTPSSAGRAGHTDHADHADLADHSDPLRRVETLWRALGAEPAVVDAEEHDRRVAWASHLPQLTASALATVLDGAAIGRTALGPGGRDATRLAGSDPRLWREILLDNHDEVGPALDALLHELTLLRRALLQHDDATLAAVLEAGRRWAIS